MSYGEPYEATGWVPQSVIKDIEARFRGFPVPGMTINPVTGTPDELRQFGLPPKPGSSAPPLLQRVWDQAFGRPLQFQKFNVEPNRIQATQFRLFEKAVAKASFEGFNYETSSNWSGAYVTANSDKRFLQVWGTWTIPGDLQLPPPGLQGPSDIPYTVRQLDRLGWTAPRDRQFVAAADGHGFHPAARRHDDSGIGGCNGGLAAAATPLPSRSG